MFLSEKEAFRAMFLFLEKYYSMTGSDEVGSLLGALSLSEDGMPIDRALWHDWLASITEIKSTPDNHFKLKLNK